MRAFPKRTLGRVLGDGHPCRPTGIGDQVAGLDWAPVPPAQGPAFRGQECPRHRSRTGRLVFLFFIMFLVGAAPVWARPQAAPGFSLPGLLPGASAPGSSAPWNIVILLTLLTMIPAIVLSMTPFVRLLVVFHFLRQALGTQTTPSNQTLIGLSLILTFFLMQPVGAAIYSDAIVPLDAGHITMMAALDRAIIPMRHFMLKYAREKDLALFVELAHEPRPARPGRSRHAHRRARLSPQRTASRVSHRRRALFAVSGHRPGDGRHHDLDRHDATAAGHYFHSPQDSSLFVVVDGWNLLIGSLMRSFA
jgi:flagellar biosynthetic protein FliP